MFAVSGAAVWHSPTARGGAPETFASTTSFMQLCLRRWPEFSRSNGISQCQRRSPSIFTSLGDISCGSAGNFSAPRPFVTQPLAFSCRTPEAALSQIFPGRGMDLQIPCMLRASPGKISACVTRSVCGECFCELSFRISAPAGSASTTRIFDGLRQVTCKSHDANRGTPNYPPLRKPWKFPGRLHAPVRPGSSGIRMKARSCS